MPRKKGPACNTRRMCGDCDQCEPLSFATSPYIHLWSKELNEKTPREVFASSHLQYWFQCPSCSHAFQAMPLNVSKGKLCPYCAIPGVKLCDNQQCEPCLKRSFASHPKAKEWVNVSIKPRQVFLNSNSYFEFRCSSCHHIYSMSPNSIVTKKTGCPYCCNPPKLLCSDSGCITCHEKSFASHPLASRWCSTNDKTPREYFLTSHYQVDLECSDCQYKYNVKLSDLNRGRTGGCLCRHKTERKLYAFLIANVQQDISYQKRFCWCKGTKYPMAFDFVIEDLKIMIELNGNQHYKNIGHFGNFETTQANDMVKLQSAMEHGYTMIHILQEDVLADRHDWAAKLLMHIREFGEPRCLTIRTRSPI